MGVNCSAALREKLPFYSFLLPAWFPSPATADIENTFTLISFDIRPPHTYLLKIEGDSMQGAGIYSGSYLVIVDRSLGAVHGDIVIAAVNTKRVCKRLQRSHTAVILILESPKYPPR